MFRPVLPECSFYMNTVRLRKRQGVTGIGIFNTKARIRKGNHGGLPLHVRFLFARFAFFAANFLSWIVIIQIVVLDRVHEIKRQGPPRLLRKREQARRGFVAAKKSAIA